MSDAPLILSASSTKTYLSCSYRYLLENVFRIPAPPNMAMAIGSAVHAGVEALHKGENLPRLNVGLSIAKDAATMAPVPSSEEMQAASDDALAMYELYKSKVAPTFTPTLVETSFIVSLDGILFSGQIDAADEDVHDTKTTDNLSSFRPSYHGFQMTGYRFGYKFLTGRWPRRLLLDVIARNGRWKQVEITPDPGDFMDALGLVRDGILSETFEPTGVETGACRRCPYFERECSFGRID